MKMIKNIIPTKYWGIFKITTKEGDTSPNLVWGEWDKIVEGRGGCLFVYIQRKLGTSHYTDDELYSVFGYYLSEDITFEGRRWFIDPSIIGENVIKLVITRTCSGFSSLRVAIWELNNNIYPSYDWINIYKDANEEKRKYMTKVYNSIKNSNAFNKERTLNSCYQRTWDEGELLYRASEVIDITSILHGNDYDYEVIGILQWMDSENYPFWMFWEFEKFTHMNYRRNVGSPYNISSDEICRFAEAVNFSEEILSMMGCIEDERDTILYVELCLEFPEHAVEIINLPYRVVDRMLHYIEDFYSYSFNDLVSLGYSRSKKKVQKMSFRIKELIESSFMKTHKRIPKIIDDVVWFYNMTHRQFSANYLAENFDVKYIKNNDLPTKIKLKIMYLYPQFKGEHNIKLLFMLPFKKMEGGMEEFVVKKIHDGFDETIVSGAVKCWKQIKKYEPMTLTSFELKSLLKRFEGETEKVLVEEKYKDRGFKFAECKFNLHFSKVEKMYDDGKIISAEILHPGDTRMFLLGYHTDCCQKLGGAGESAMMYGLVADNAGFWAMSDGDDIVAQGEIWEDDNDPNCLMFDNIEINDGYFKKYHNRVIEMLQLWVEKSKYTSIQMGMGYNELSVGITTAELCKLLKVDYYDNPPKKFKQRSVGFTAYTDTSEFKWLKYNGQMLFGAGEYKL